MIKNLDCLRDILFFVYNNLDELGKIHLDDILKSPDFESYLRSEIIATLNHCIKKHYFSAIPGWDGAPPIITDITYDACVCMRNLV